MLPVAVLAGGLGTRARPLTGDRLPKVLVPVAGRPFLDHKLDELASCGVERVVLLLGYGAALVRRHVGDGGDFGLSVTCVDDGGRRLGTGGAVRAALDLLGDTFWVTYGDTLLTAPMAAVERRFLASGLDGLMTVLHNRRRWGPSNTSVRNGRVVAYGKGDPPGTHEHIDYGLLLFRASVFERFAPGARFDLAEVVAHLAAARTLGAHVVRHRFWDIGTPEAHAATDAMVRRRLRQRERAST